MSKASASGPFATKTDEFQKCLPRDPGLEAWIYFKASDSAQRQMGGGVEDRRLEEREEGIFVKM